MEPVRVVQYQRRPQPGQVSIELVFAAVRAHLPPDVEVEVVTSRFFSKGLLPRLRAILEARRAQGPVTHVLGDVHFVDLLMRRRTTVLTVHDTEFLTRWGGLKGWIYTWVWLRLPVLRAGVVTVVSQASRRDLVAVLGRDPGVQVVLNPVRPAFTPGPPRPPNPRPVVLLMGTWPNKNVPRSAEALQGLDVQVELVGPVEAPMRALMDAALPGWVHHERLDDQQVVEVLRRCDVLLFPSTQEGFGLPIVEAQAVGRPVVTSALPPMSEVAGDAACLVDPYDVAAVRAGVQRVLGDPAYAAGLVEAGLVNARRFSPDDIAEQYAAIYRAVAAVER